MATGISTNFRTWATRALSKRSANSPPSADRRKYGAINTALAKVIRASASLALEWKRITKTRAVFRKLSLNAAKNWHQKSGAKRLETINGGMPPIIAEFPDACAGKKTGGLAAALTFS